MCARRFGEVGFHQNEKPKRLRLKAVSQQIAAKHWPLTFATLLVKPLKQVVHLYAITFKQMDRWAIFSMVLLPMIAKAHLARSKHVTAQ